MLLDFNHKFGLSTKTHLVLADVSACSNSKWSSLPGLEKFEFMFRVSVTLLTVQFLRFGHFHGISLYIEKRVENT